MKEKILKILKILSLIIIIAIPLSFSITYGTDFTFKNVINEVFINTQENDIVNQIVSLSQRIRRDISRRTIAETKGTDIIGGAFVPLNKKTGLSEKYSKEIFCAAHNHHVSRVDEAWVRVQNIIFNDPDYPEDPHKTDDGSYVAPGFTQVIPKTEFRNRDGSNFPINSEPYIDPEDYYGEITVNNANDPTWGARDYTYTKYTIDERKTLSSTNIGEAKRAYIYAEMDGNAISPEADEAAKDNGNNGLYPSYVQLAMWTTEDNNSEDTGKGEGTEEAQYKAKQLLAEAEAFESYLKKHSASVSRGEPKETLNSATVTYSKDGYFLIGPFSLTYLRDFTQVEGRDFVDFCGMSGITIKGDAGIISNWEFFYENPKKTMAGDRADYNFPYSNEEFYIRIQQTSEVLRNKKIASITFEFENLHVEATVNYMNGEIGKDLSVQIQQWNTKMCTDGYNRRDSRCQYDAGVEHSSHIISYTCSGCKTEIVPDYIDEDAETYKGYEIYNFNDGTRRIFYCNGHQVTCQGVNYCDCDEAHGGKHTGTHWTEKYYQLALTPKGTRQAQRIVNVVEAKKYMSKTELILEYNGTPTPTPTPGTPTPTPTIPDWELSLVTQISGKVWLDGHESKSAEVDGILNEPRSKRSKSNTT